MAIRSCVYDYDFLVEGTKVIARLSSGRRCPGTSSLRQLLHYNYFRDFDPAIGRYLESDPIGLDGGFNTYGYVLGNPLGLVDSLGLSADGGDCPPNPGLGGAPLSCKPCGQGFMDCMANCISRYDPLGDPGKGLATAAGGTGPKRMFGVRRGTGGSSRLTTVPSWIGHNVGGSIGKGLRGFGRICSPLWVAYGVGLAGMEVYCASQCANDQCAF